MFGCAKYHGLTTSLATTLVDAVVLLLPLFKLSFTLISSTLTRLVKALGVSVSLHMNIGGRACEGASHFLCEPRNLIL